MQVVLAHIFGLYFALADSLKFCHRLEVASELDHVELKSKILLKTALKDSWGLVCVKPWGSLGYTWEIDIVRKLGGLYA